MDLNAYALAEDVELTLVLKAGGVELALSAAHARAATIGGIEVPAPTAGDDLRALLESGVEVLAVEEDVAARGLGPEDLLPGVRTVAETEIAAAVTAHDATLTWTLT